MKTDDLIRALAEDTAVEASPARRTLPLLLPAAALSLLLVVVILKPRPDLATALVSFVPAMRHVLSLALFGTAFLAALSLTRPEGQRRTWPIGLVLAAALALVLWAWATTPPDARLAALMGSSANFCVIAIPLLAIFPTAALFLAFRSGATTRPTLSGALIGLAGGGLGAAVYAVHCTEVSPLFFVTWYGLAVLAVSGISALLGRRILRW